MLTYGVGQRALQEWLRAGVVPGVIRTKKGKGHYRIRAPKGMTPDHYYHALTHFGLGGLSAGTTSQRVRQAFSSGLPETWWNWQVTLAQNVTDYRGAMRQVRRVCRGKTAVPFFTLSQMKAHDRAFNRRRRTTSSAKTSSSVEPF